MVMSGALYIGLGSRFDDEQLQAYSTSLTAVSFVHVSKTRWDWSPRIPASLTSPGRRIERYHPRAHDDGGEGPTSCVERGASARSPWDQQDLGRTVLASGAGAQDDRSHVDAVERRRNHR
jgi:hypothetical protein